MPSRKKRLKKGIESVQKSIKKHEQKIKKAESEDQVELINYYKKEIKGMKDQLSRKKKFLDK